jgi:hypothetical protein
MAAVQEKESTIATAPDAGESADVERPPRHSVIVGIILTGITVATVVMVSFIWYRWQAVREPTTQIIVDGDETFDGTVVTVRGPQQFTTTLSKSNNYHAPVLLAPGRYVVTAERNGLPILIKEVEVKRFAGLRFDLVEYVKKGGIAAELTRIEPTPTTTSPASSSNP